MAGDLRERDANILRNPDDGYAAQHILLISSLVAGGAAARDQSLALIEVNGGYAGAASPRKFTDGPFHVAGSP
jgi:hypothetical protein